MDAPMSFRLQPSLMSTTARLSSHSLGQPEAHSHPSSVLAREATACVWIFAPHARAYCHARAKIRTVRPGIIMLSKSPQPVALATSLLIAFVAPFLGEPAQRSQWIAIA